MFYQCVEAPDNIIGGDGHSVMPFCLFTYIEDNPAAVFRRFYAFCYGAVTCESLVRALLYQILVDKPDTPN